MEVKRQTGLRLHWWFSVQIVPEIVSEVIFYKFKIAAVNNICILVEAFGNTVCKFQEVIVWNRSDDFKTQRKALSI